MKREIFNFLKSQCIMTLASVTKENIPQASVLLYIIDDSFNIYFATHSTSRKAQNIRYNNAVSLAVWKQKALSVQLEGKAEIVTNEQEQKKILEALANAALKQEDFYPPVLRIRGQEYSIFKIKPTHCRYLSLQDEHINEFSTVINEVKL